VDTVSLGDDFAHLRFGLSARDPVHESDAELISECPALTRRLGSLQSASCLFPQAKTQESRAAEADGLVTSLMAAGHCFALPPQTLAEFIHIVTDAKRMPKPLAMSEAIARAEHWWQAAKVVRVFPDGDCVMDFLGRLSRHQLGRKRLLDTLLAATFHLAGIRRPISNNERDYKVLGNFEILTFR